MYYAAFLIEGYCDHLPPLSERYWTFLILRTVELLPIRIIFIDRIIDRICFLSVTLTTELLTPAQIEPCCRVVVACDSLWQPNIPPSNDVHSVDALVLYGNAIHSIWGILFNRVNPDRVTLCDATRRADAFLFLNIRRIIVFSTLVRNWHIIELYSNFWNHPTSSHFWLFYANSSTCSLWSNQWWVSSSPTPSSSIFRKYFNISQAQYQSIHESQIINIS